MDTISDVNRDVIKLWEKWAKQLAEIDKDFKVPLVYPSRELPCAKSTGRLSDFIVQTTLAV